MTKVPRRGRTDNGRGAGLRRQHGSPFSDLRDRVRSLERGLDRNGAALGAFLESLSADQRNAIVRDWVKSPRSIQKHLHKQIYAAIGGIGGPAETLFGELREERNARLDGLPEPAPELPPDGQPTADELTARFVARGMAENDARSLAADLSRSDDELTRAFWGETGLPPEAVEEAVAEHRRRRKWAAVVDDQLPEKLAAQEEQRTKKVRPHVNEAARLAASLGDPLTRLAWCLDRIDLDLRVNSDGVREAWAAIRSEASDGSFTDMLAAVAEMLKAVANEMQTIQRSLRLSQGGQKADPARKAAAKHRARGLTYEQIAEALVTDGIVPETYTAENVRDLLRKAGKQHQH